MFFTLRCSGCYIARCVNGSLGFGFIVHNPQVMDGLGKSNHPDTFPPYRVRSNSLNAAKLHIIFITANKIGKNFNLNANFANLTNFASALSICLRIRRIILIWHPLSLSVGGFNESEEWHPLSLFCRRIRRIRREKVRLIRVIRGLKEGCGCR